MNGAPALKPLTVLEILDAAFRLYRQNFGTFLGIMAVAYVPFFVVIMATSSIVVGGGQELITVREPGAPPEINPAALGALVVLALGGLLLAFIALPVATGALTRAVGDRYLDQPTSIGRSYGRIMGIIFGYLGAIILSSLVQVLGIMCCIVPGMFFFTWFILTAPVCVLEGVGGTKAMGRSYELSRGHRWRILGLGCLAFLVTQMLGGSTNAFGHFVLPLLVENLMIRFLIQQAIDNVLSLLLAPYWGVAWVLLYYDLRIRKEAFDLEVLAKSMGGHAAPGSVPP